MTRKEMEKRRMLAADLFSKNFCPAEVATSLEVSMNSACRWMKKWHKDQQGLTGLKASRGQGRKSRLSPEQLESLRQDLAVEGWKTHTFADHIFKRFRVRLCADHVGRIMHNLGWKGRGK